MRLTKKILNPYAMIDCQKILDSSQKVDVDVKIDTNINNGLLVCGECSLLPLPACLSHHICGNQTTTLTLETILTYYKF